MEILPLLSSIVQNQMGQQFQSQFGDVMPAINETVALARSNRARDAAVSDLETGGFKGLRDLMKPGQGVIKFKDPDTGHIGEFPNTPLNAILARHPEILSIKRDHKDPETALRLTMTAIYRQAMRIHQGQSVKPENAQRLLKAGQAIEQKRQQDRTRQTLNAGPGATSRGGSKGDDFLANQIGGSKVSKLFK